MKIERELIKVYPYWLIRSFRAVATRQVQELKKANIDLTIEQWEVLLIVENNDGESQKLISRKTVKDTANIHRILTQLIKKGFVVKTPDPNDGRKTIINITESALKTIEKALPIMDEIRKLGVQDISEKEFDFMMSALKKIYHNLE